MADTYEDTITTISSPMNAYDWFDEEYIVSNCDEPEEKIIEYLERDVNNGRLIKGTSKELLNEYDYEEFEMEGTEIVYKVA